MAVGGDTRWALVTGGTDGIGKSIAHRLAARGLCVIVVGSNAEKGETAARALCVACSTDRVHFVQADLSLMRNVERLAEQVRSLSPWLDYLVHSAGIVRGRRILTAEGIESNFAVGYLSRFALTRLLLPFLSSPRGEGPAARILVISGAKRGGVVHYDDINLARKFSTLAAVFQLCEANDLFVLEQSRRLAAANLGSRVTIAALKVGAVRTNIRKQFPLWMKVAVPLRIDPFLTVSPDEIAASAESLLFGREFEGKSGAVFTQIKRLKATLPGRRTADPQDGRRLWELSERLVSGALAERCSERQTV
jgi:NAD(P)-dependent dehydrogenase (short-subunit alcohol dehydrogenase family)